MAGRGPVNGEPRRRIHIVGASGSGTTTLGRALAQALDIDHLDTDDYYWMPTDPPFSVARPRNERLQLLGTALDSRPSWALTGSLIDWGDAFIPKFTLVVFLYVPTEARIARLRAREQLRYGSAVDPGGPLYEKLCGFLEWAAGYDEAKFDGRSLQRHNDWLARLPCPVIEISGEPALEESVGRVLKAT